MKTSINFVLALLVLVLTLSGCIVDETSLSPSLTTSANKQEFGVLVSVDGYSLSPDVTPVNAPAGCTSSCDDGNACTTDTCDVMTGKCTNTSKSWDCWPCATDEDCSLGMVTCQGDGLIHEDGYGVCLPDKTCEVFHKTKSCDDDNPCTVDGCTTEDDIVSCENIVVFCGDGFDCTVDTCDTVTGKCQHDNAECGGPSGGSGGLCASVADCDDGNPCTSDPCWEGECWGHPFGCDDNDPCTNDTCDIKQVCGHQTVPGCKP